MSSPIVVKKLLQGAVLALSIGLLAPALASADAPDVTSARGFVVANNDGSHTVRVEGTWAWNTHHSDCNTDRAGVGVAIDWGEHPNGNFVTNLNGQDLYVGVNPFTSFNRFDNVAHPAEPGVDISDPSSQAANWRGGCGSYGSHPAGSDVDLSGKTVTLPAGTYPSGTWGCNTRSNNVTAQWAAACASHADYLPLSGNARDTAFDGSLSHTYAPGVKLPTICALMYDP